MFTNLDLLNLDARAHTELTAIAEWTIFDDENVESKGNWYAILR